MGLVADILADHLDHIRLITTDQRLFVGAANIGIHASRGNTVGFLAGDCCAMPGWVAGRMREHDLGAKAVSNPVVPSWVQDHWRWPPPPPNAQAATL